MKQTEIGLIPDDWEVKRLGEIAFLKSGKTIDFSTTKEGIYPCYGGNGIRTYIPFYSYDGAFPIIGRQGELCGNVQYANGKFYATEHAVVCTPNSNVDSKWLYYQLIKADINKYKTGNAQPGISVDKINNEVCIPLPPLPEQQRIAKALSDADALISTTEKLIQKKENIKQGTMQELLTGKKRLPCFAKSNNTKMTELGEIPEDWEIKSIKDFAKVYDGTHQTPHYVDVGIPFYSVENVTANDFEHTKLISEKEHRFLTSKVKIEKGDILMTRIGSIGDCKYIDWEPEASFYVSLALIKCDTSVDARFISYYSNSLQFKKELELRSLITAIPQKINLGPISEIILVLPPKKEQTAIANVLSSMDKEIENLNTKLEKYRNLKTAMIQQLLTGKFRL